MITWETPGVRPTTESQEPPCASPSPHVRRQRRTPRRRRRPHAPQPPGLCRHTEARGDLHGHGRGLVVPALLFTRAVQRHRDHRGHPPHLGHDLGSDERRQHRRDASKLRLQQGAPCPALEAKRRTQPSVRGRRRVAARAHRTPRPGVRRPAAGAARRIGCRQRGEALAVQRRAEPLARHSALRQQPLGQLVQQGPHRHRVHHMRLPRRPRHQHGTLYTDGRKGRAPLHARHREAVRRATRPRGRE